MKKAAVVRLIPNIRPMKEWARKINAAWREQVGSIIETGNLLEAAKTELVESGRRAEWRVMIEVELPFRKAMANRLIAIAQCDHFRNGNGAHVRQLPASWSTLSELTKLTAEQFAAGIKSGAIHPKMERKDVRALRGIEPLTKKKEGNPKDIDDWCGDIIVRITEAVATLKKEDAVDLMKRLQKVLKEMEQSDV